MRLLESNSFYKIIMTSFATIDLYYCKFKSGRVSTEGQRLGYNALLCKACTSPVIQSVLLSIIQSVLWSIIQSVLWSISKARHQTFTRSRKLLLVNIICCLKQQVGHKMHRYMGTLVDKITQYQS